MHKPKKSKKIIHADKSIYTKRALIQKQRLKDLEEDIETLEDYQRDMNYNELEFTTSECEATIDSINRQHQSLIMTDMKGVKYAR